MKKIYDDSIYLMGTNYHQNDAKKIMEDIGQQSPYWEKSDKFISNHFKTKFKDIYRYYKVRTEDVKIIREPNNSYDKNAVKVTVNGKLAGYLPAEIAKKYNRAFKVNSPYKIQATLAGRGGEYKTLNKTLTSVISKEKYISFYLDLTIYQIDKVSQNSAENQTFLNRLSNWFKN